ncbi:MAG: hypothetical protein QF475_02850 [Candidatus Undinarchaeales archaeon]|jgi:hypothetical protein|nr:hypothetical protein [Candidatus Undinarchaeales archaeon]
MKKHLLLIGESHPKGEHFTKVSNHYVTEIKEFNGKKVCLEMPRTEHGIKICESIKTAGWNPDKLQKELKEYFDNSIVKNLEQFKNHKLYFIKVTEEEKEKIREYVAGVVQRIRQGREERGLAIKKTYIILEIVGLCRVRDFEFIDTSGSFIRFLFEIDDYFRERIEKEKKITIIDCVFRWRRIRKQKRIRADLENRKKTLLIIAKSARKRNYPIYKNLMKVLDNKTVVITGKTHAEYIYKKLKGKKEYVVRFVIIDKDGKKKVIDER